MSDEDMGVIFYIKLYIGSRFKWMPIQKKNT